MPVPRLERDLGQGRDGSAAHERDSSSVTSRCFSPSEGFRGFSSNHPNIH